MDTLGILTTKPEVHWNYFLAIERDLEVLSRFVEFDKRNFDCFSLEIARIVLAAGAEVDVVCKQICLAINPGSTADKIHAYRLQITSAIPNISSFQVLVPRFGLTLKPWSEWRLKAGVPVWWTAYNKVKHHRHTNYEQANLKNAISAVAGLFVAVLYLYRQKAETGELLPPAQMFAVEGAHAAGFVIGGNPVYQL